MRVRTLAVVSMLAACRGPASGSRPTASSATAPAAVVPCAEPACPFYDVPVDTQLFIEALDELFAGGGGPSYERLKAEFPDSSHTVRVRAVSTRFAALRDRLHLAAKELQKQRDDEAACLTTIDKTTRERDRLRQDLEQLKRVMLEAELRPR